MITFDVPFLVLNRFYLCFGYKIGTDQVLFKTEESILLMFWLQNMYKSSILKPKNRFYLLFDYKVDINQVYLNRRTDWDPNPKVHRVVPVL